MQGRRPRSRLQLSPVGNYQQGWVRKGEVLPRARRDRPYAALYIAPILIDTRLHSTRGQFFIRHECGACIRLRTNTSLIHCKNKRAMFTLCYSNLIIDCPVLNWFNEMLNWFNTFPVSITQYKRSLCSITALLSHPDTY